MNDDTPLEVVVKRRCLIRGQHCEPGVRLTLTLREARALLAANRIERPPGVFFPSRVTGK